jgi:transposase InsO family protein
MTSLQEREEIVTLIQTAVTSGARVPKACDEAGISLRTYRRWYQDKAVVADKRPEAVRPTPKHKLTEEEKATIIETCNNEENANKPPTQIVPALLDKGIYIASESSFYRVLSEYGQNNHRGRAQARTARALPETFEASGPNQVWTWDISYCPTHVIGLFFYLYMFMDIYSRKIVGYEVHDRECGTLSSELVERCMLSEGNPSDVVLHSDNGGPMKCMTMKAKLVDLEVIGSYSRPRVSNDNPFSESLFRTVKYCPAWPSNGFTSLEQAREWAQEFVDWYNNEHRHSKIDFVTPCQRHNGEHVAILEARKQVLELAKQRTPKRWTGNVRRCVPTGPVTLNPGRVKKAG